MSESSIYPQQYSNIQQGHVYEPQAPSEQKEGVGYRFSVEERNVLMECNRESFLYRCLPISGSFMAATHYLVSKGVLTAHPKWGSTFKVLGAGIIGYVIGKFSYRSTCEEKIMQIPNSKLADMIKKRRGYQLESITNEPNTGKDLYPSFGMMPESRSDDPYYSSSSGSLNLDTDKNVPSHGLDDSKRPTIDSSDTPTSDQDKQSTVKRFTTYDELRRTNRDEYEATKSRPGLYQPPPPPRQPGNLEKREPERPTTGPIYGIGVKRNEYGDVWED